MPEVLYRPSAWQEKFHYTKADEIMGAGAAGPGKTEALLMDPILTQMFVEHARMTQREADFALIRDPEIRQLARRHPIQRGMSRGWALHLRRELIRLSDSIARTHRVFPQIDPGAHFNSQSNTWEFSCGYKFEFGHCQNVNDWQRYMGREFTHLGIDELVELEQVQYDQISLRLRSSDPVLGRLVVRKSVTNPVQAVDNKHIATSDPMWVRKRFVDPCRGGNKILRTKVKSYDGTERYATRIFLPATLYDHPDPEYIKRYEFSLLQAPTYMKRALLYGDWYHIHGSYFGEDWNEKLHITRPFKVPADWPQFRSMDWGHKSPGCVHWWTMDEDENLYCIRELTFKGQTDIEVAELIRGIEESMDIEWRDGKSPITGPADTQLWEERGGTGLNMAAAMARAGVYWKKADKRKGSRVGNAMKLTKRLRDHNQGTTTPGFVVFDGCKKLIETLPSIQATTNDPNVPMDGGDDHWLDSAFYAVNYASRGKIGVSMVSNQESEPWEAFYEDKPATHRGYGIDY